jgi:PKD repeat protein
LEIDFTDNSSGDISGWSWDFGDGNSSTEQNPSHTYSEAGTYTVSLTVTGDGGTDTETKTDYITVTIPAPVAAFTSNKTTGDAPLEIDFTDNSSGDISGWSWDFGDGNTSTEQNPSHTYSEAGTYTVSLTVTGDGGPDTETKTEYITVTVPPPDADFIADTTSGYLQLTVNFTDSSTGHISSWLWDFGDEQTSTEQNPTHTYTDAGTYTVSLTVTGDGGTDTETKTDYITVADPTSITTSGTESILEIYPNPFTDYTTIKLSDAVQTQKIELIDIHGRIVRTIDNVNSNSVTIHRDNLPSGIYFIRIHSDDTYVKKVIIR